MISRQTTFGPGEDRDLVRSRCPSAGKADTSCRVGLVQSLGNNKAFRMLALRDSNPPTLLHRVLLKPFCTHVVVGDDAGLTGTPPDVIRRF